MIPNNIIAVWFIGGLIEAANAADDFFGLERLKAAFATGAALPLDAAAEALLVAVDTWSGQLPADDLTIVVVENAASGSLHATTER